MQIRAYSSCREMQSWTETHAAPARGACSSTCTIDVQQRDAKGLSCIQRVRSLQSHFDLTERQACRSAANMYELECGACMPAEAPAPAPPPPPPSPAPPPPPPSPLPPSSQPRPPPPAHLGAPARTQLDQAPGSPRSRPLASYSDGWQGPAGRSEGACRAAGAAKFHEPPQWSSGTLDACIQACHSNCDCLAFEFSMIGRTSYCELHTRHVTHTVPVHQSSVCLVKPVDTRTCPTQPASLAAHSDQWLPPGGVPGACRTRKCGPLPDGAPVQCTGCVASAFDGCNLGAFQVCGLRFI